MKSKFAIALSSLALTGTSLAIGLVTYGLVSATAATAADIESIYGKRVTTTEEIAQSPRGSFDIYVDRVSGFTFVNTMSGWKMTGQLGGDALKSERDAVKKL